jgi:glyoxylate reductase
MSSKPIIAVTRVLPDAGMKMLADASDIEVRVWPGDLPPTRDELVKLVDGANAVISLVTDTIDADLLDQHPSIRTVSNFAVGYDNIDIAAATERSVLVCNTPGVLTETTADLTFALLVSAARRIVEGVEYVRAGKWQTWSPTLLLGQDLHDATIAIIGFGRIGREVAKRAAGFSMRILAVTSDPTPRVDAETGATYTDLDTALKEADFVCLNVALNDETRGMIGAREFGLMKRSAILVNAARGPVVDTDALTDALKHGVIAGAALDVTDPEPLPSDHPLIQLENCIVVPHIASGSVATRAKMARMAATNAIEAVRGNQPPNIVNDQVWEARTAV